MIDLKICEFSRTKFEEVDNGEKISRRGERRIANS